MKSIFKKISPRYKIFLLIGAIFLISIPPRIWELTKYPRMIVDEPANLRDIQKLRLEKGFHPAEYEWGFAQATLVHYPTIFLINLGIEDQYYALRLTSAILSILALIPFFLILRKHTNDLIAFATTFLFSYSYFFLQFSRVGWTNIHMLTLSLYLFWSVEHAVEAKKHIWFFVSGLFAGLLLYTYRAGEITIISSLLYIAIKNMQKKVLIKKMVANISIVSITALIISTPWTVKILSDWNQYTLRERVVSVFNAPKPYHNLSDNISILTYQTYAALKSFVFMLPHEAGGIESQRYLPLPYTTISPFLIPILLIGFYIALKSFKKTFHWFAIFIPGLIFGQILTVDPPNGSRGIILLPIIYLLIGVAMFGIYKRFEKMKYTKACLLSFSFVVALIDFLYYIYWMSWIKV